MALLLRLLLLVVIPAHALAQLVCYLVEVQPTQEQRARAGRWLLAGAVLIFVLWRLPPVLHALVPLVREIQR
jgi:hypothetical protein